MPATNGKIRKQISDLANSDLEAHPIWVHLCEDSESGIDEETVEAFEGHPRDLKTMYVIRAKFKLKSGAEYLGFVYPESSMEYSQPVLFASENTPIHFWYGIRKPLKEDMDLTYSALGNPEEIFPLRWEIDYPDPMYQEINRTSEATVIDGFGYFSKSSGRTFTI